MSWASRRRFKYFSIIILLLGIIIFIISYPLIFKKQSCFDNRKNGDETGVDCGGSCSSICKEDIHDPIIVWSRAFLVTGNSYNLVALVKNINKNAVVELASYEFKVYDDNNKLIAVREGTTYIPLNQQFAIFEPRFDMGRQDIKTVTFEFKSPLVWEGWESILQTLPIKISNIFFDNDTNTPSLSALITNESIYDLPEFDIVAILYDTEHNAINASKTVKEELISNKNIPIFFTWPESFKTQPATQDIIIQVNPYSIPF